MCIRQTPSWMPVDLVAKSVIDICGLDGSSERTGASTTASGIYHIQNTRLFHWTRDLLPALQAAGLNFRTVSQREWVSLLRQSNPDPDKNPTIKLLDFFADKYDNDRPGRSSLVFVTKQAEEASRTMRDGYEMIASGLVAKIAQWLATQW